MDFSISNYLVVVFALAVGVVYICQRLKVPSIVAFLITGIIAGPHCLTLVASLDEVELLAEIGVILLLFSIGIEFSFRSLLDIKKTVLLGGSIQVGLSILMAFGLAYALGMPVNQAIFLGFMVSLSSTAIVLKLLGERSELATPQGKVMLGTLIYQDIIVVPMILITPILAATHLNTEPGWEILLKALAVMIFLLLIAVYVIPTLLYKIASTQSRELFLISIMVICFSIAWLTYSVGLSIALGAFLAGLIISESEYSHQALSNITPFIDTFTSLFFISIGMLLNLSVLMEHIDKVILITLALLVGKAIAATIATIALRLPLRVAILVGFGLCQVGEFSFILAQTGIQYNLLSPELYQGFLSSAIITMILTPFLMAYAPRIAEKANHLKLPTKLIKGSIQNNLEEEEKEMSGHLIIIGYGVNGKNISQAVAAANIPYIILEINPDTVINERLRGEPIYYGDACQEMVLKHACIDSAKILVVAIHDSAATRRITDLARRMNPALHIIVRTRFVKDIEDLHYIGANEVIPEEYETSIEIFSRVLARYLVPRDEIENYIQELRKEDYEMFRKMDNKKSDFHDLAIHLSDYDLSTVKLDKRSFMVGKSLIELDLRNKYGINVLAIRRAADIIPNPNGDDILQAGDVLIILGDAKDFKNICRTFNLLNCS